MVRVDHHEVSNDDGWLLSLRRTRQQGQGVPGRNPLLIVPGYGMNSFIFSYHPRGLSLEGYLASRGFEVWSVDLRNTGRSRSDGGSRLYGFCDLILKDVHAAVHGVRDRTQTGSSKVDIIGCSLGATMMFAYVACVADNPVGRMVSMGGALRWVKVHPAIRLASTSPRLVGLLPIRGVRPFASFALPKLKRVPWLLTVYLHPGIVDLSQSEILAQAVENPNRRVSRDVARWIKDGDLMINGRNICEGVGAMQNPLLTVIANGDGIVPRETALWPHLHIGSSRRDLLEVGTHSQPIAHADMFISDMAPTVVFEPLADWLET